MEIKNVLELEDKKTKRTGKEIKIDGELFGNKNLKFKIGASFDKQRPETIYIELGFWIDIKKRHHPSERDKYSFIDYDYDISRKLSNYLRRIYRKDLREILNNNDIFPSYLDNIFIYDFPDNINYNKKRSFVSLEINLHTININKQIEENYSLSEKGDNKIFNEALKVCKIISNTELLKGKLDFTIHRFKKD
tara:strand:+ start:1197 stop:1772 length:576 start_codon:yes stop_codon:yes gene_type:complete